MRFLPFLLLFGCATTPPAPPPEPTCENACANQRRLGCELGQPTREGSTCEEVCEVFRHSPPALQWDLRCLLTASSCRACN
ncbi:hypothetical protein KW797_00245 [Candidatus Parcubacteria bacterium]|nr:hypothetical protein [Candidatus Parcubacteria bacterium]